MFKKIKSIYRNGFIDIPNFRNTFPELSEVSDEEIKMRFNKLNVNFYNIAKVDKSRWFIRITLPFGIVIILFLIFYLPYNYMFTGDWRYDISKNKLLYNWLSELFN